MSLYPPEFAQKYKAAGYWTNDTFTTFLSDAAEKYANNEAVVGCNYRGQEERLTYSQLAAKTQKLAARFADLGITAADRVIIQVPNITDYLRIVFAIFQLGAIPVFCLPAHRHAEVAHFIAFSQAKAYITVGVQAGVDYRRLAREVLAEYLPESAIAPLVIIADRDAEEFIPLDAEAESCGAALEPACVDPEGMAFLQMSGGTTGIPKLIARSHADYLYSVRESARICRLDVRSRMLVVLPAAHNFTMSSPGILGVLYAGGTVVFAGDPTPSTGFDAIEKERITITALVPPLAMAWLAAWPGIDRDISSLRTLQVGGAKFPPEAARRVQPELGCQLQQVFGMAEGLVNYTRFDDPDDLIVNTQGCPISPDDEIKIVDDEGNLVAQGERGYLLTRGPYTIRGYYGGVDPSAFDEDGFYRTGDIVRQLPSGHLVVEGRDKDQINRSGEKTSAEEVENHLVSYPRVIDAAVVGIPDPYLGERTCAFVLATDPPDAAELLDFLRSRGLASYKIPDQVLFASEFPTTGVGKISRKQLRRQLREHVIAHASPAGQ